jgi:Mn-dependent DtxR family transcriptional regulator
MSGISPALTFRSFPGDFTMAKVKAFHTDSPEYAPKHREVYHDKDTCPDGKKIQSKHRVEGTGNKKHCLECDKVS